jgi:hypothetical protein
MGTYTDFTIAGYSVLSTKSAVMPEAMTIFRETDRREYKRHAVTQHPIDPLDLPDMHSDDIEEAFEYACEVRKVIDRLNVMGFTLARTKRDFEQGRDSELLKYRSWSEDEAHYSSWESEIKFLESLSFEDYLVELSTVVTEKVYSYTPDGEPQRELSPLMKHIVEDTDEYLFGFFAEDVRCLVRAVCEVAPADQYVVQDVSQLVSGGYYDTDTKVCADAIQALVAGHPENSTQIILTEGSTDTSILRRALDLLHPHLSGYYSFLDFESSKSPGGAGHLVSLVKSFAAAGITNRVVALFDNDTAAREATRALAHIHLPRNIAVRSYPDLEVLRSYPTLGPSGEIDLDVNGLAASIELYLGLDVLRQLGGTLTPVQWKGYNETLSQYQGEVIRKAQLQQAFNQKVEAARANPAALAQGDWSGLTAILKEVFTAFDNEAQLFAPADAPRPAATTRR